MFAHTNYLSEFDMELISKTIINIRHDALYDPWTKSMRCDPYFIQSKEQYHCCIGIIAYFDHCVSYISIYVINRDTFVYAIYTFVYAISPFICIFVNINNMKCCSAKNMLVCK